MAAIPGECWLVDFEFSQPEGERPRPVCMVARAFHSGETKRVWLWDNPPAACPIPLGPGSLYVAYLASAEIGCHLELGWGPPKSVLDLFAEFSWMVSGRTTPRGRGLLGALTYFGLGGISAEEKTGMRELAIRGGPYTKAEADALMDYCESDVVALSELLPKMWPHIDFPRALLRGRYMVAVTRAERTGIPVDADTFERLRDHWGEIKSGLVAEVDRHFGIYEGQTFKSIRWLAWCAKNGIRWPRLESGAPDLKRQTFRDMSARYPEILPIYELRTTLAEMRLNALSVGSDGRNRYLSGVFRTKTGRNAPSNTRGIFGPARWIRSLIKPKRGMAIAYVDWSQQELGIAAKLSGDLSLMDAYRSGDPYLAFAKMAGAAPADATKKSHPREREIYKVAALAVLMGMGPVALGWQTGEGEAMGYRLLRQHKELFPRYWKWSDAGVDHAMMGSPLQSVFGWRIYPGEAKPTTYRNFRLQANGAEMLRLAAIAITERGIRLCAMVHDAVLIEAPTTEIEEVVAEVRHCMGEASKAVLGGFEIGTDAEVVRWPDRFRDGRGGEMWDRILGLLKKAQTEHKKAQTDPPVSSY